MSGIVGLAPPNALGIRQEDWMVLIQGYVAGWFGYITGKVPLAFGGAKPTGTMDGKR